MDLQSVHRCETDELCRDNMSMSFLSMGLSRTHLYWKIYRTEGTKLYMEALDNSMKQEGYFFYDHNGNPRIHIIKEGTDNT